jgi:hypothetical protein
MIIAEYDQCTEFTRWNKEEPQRKQWKKTGKREPLYIQR